MWDFQSGEQYLPKSREGLGDGGAAVAGQACLPSAGLSIQGPPGEARRQRRFSMTLFFHLPSQTFVPSFGTPYLENPPALSEAL